MASNTYTGLVVQCMEGLNPDAPRDPASEDDVVVREFPVGVQRVRLVDGEISLIVDCLWGSGSPGHWQGANRCEMVGLGQWEGP